MLVVMVGVGTVCASCDGESGDSVTGEGASWDDGSGDSVNGDSVTVEVLVLMVGVGTV